MPTTFSDVLLIGGRPNQWVKYVNNDANAAHVYVSTAVSTFASTTTGSGVYTFTNPVPGIYTSYTIDGALSSTQPVVGDVRWAPTGITSHVIPLTNGDDAALHSGSFLSTGPYTNTLPGNAAVVTPTGVVAGQVWDYGGQAWQAWVFGPKGDGVTDDAVVLAAWLAKPASLTAVTATASAGGTAEMGQGVFYTSTTQETTRDMTLQGAGWGSVLRSSTANPILQMKADASNTEVRGAVWRNFVLDGMNTANGLTGAQTVKWGTGGSPTVRTGAIESVEFINCSIGLRLVFTQGLAIRDSKFVYCLTGCYIADNSQLGGFSSCDFRHNTTVGLRLESTGVISGGTDQPYVWAFTACHFELNGIGTIIDGCSSNSFYSCKWEAQTTTSVVIQKVSGSFEPLLNQFVGCLWNGNASAPTMLQVDLQEARNTVFSACVFNAANTNGINIAANAWDTQFLNCSTGSTITDASAALVRTNHYSPAASRTSMGRKWSTLTDAATIAVDASLNDLFRVTLGGNRAMGTPTNPKTGQRITFKVVQDGTGGRTLTFNFPWRTAWSDTGNTLGKQSTVSFIYDDSVAEWMQDGAQSPYIIA